ncbi:MAG TPA: metalloregulator ArsR/SmtB family transcription factor [Ktedonobacteraceae bacterium]|nr:metalloregulator ArsR/SmtB family transcription factor [Ktedonobacteraceae bacterium]
MDDLEKTVATPRRNPTQEMPPIELEMGQAFDFIESLLIYYDNDWEGLECTYEIGKDWFEHIRTSCSPEMLAGLDSFTLQVPIVHGKLDSWYHLMGMVYDAPAPRDVSTFMAYLESLEPWEILLNWLGYYQRDLRRIIPLDVILQMVEQNKEAVDLFFRTVLPGEPNAQERIRSLIFSDGNAMKSRLISLLWDWYEQVIRPDEARIRPILERDLEAKRKLQTTVSPEKMVELATNGLVYESEPGVRTIVLVPSFFGRPWNVSITHHDVKLIAYPVADESVRPDRSTPLQLVRIYQALGDERRLQILKMLKQRSYSLQEFSEEFGVAKSTMHHHLGILRTAGLVRIRGDDRFYSLREETLPTISTLLEDFLNNY